MTREQALYKLLDVHFNDFLNLKKLSQSICITECKFNTSDDDKQGLVVEMLSYGMFIGWYNIGERRKTNTPIYQYGGIIKIDKEMNEAYVIGILNIAQQTLVTINDPMQREFYTNEFFKSIKILSRNELLKFD